MWIYKIGSTFLILLELTTRHFVCSWAQRYSPSVEQLRMHAFSRCRFLQSWAAFNIVAATQNSVHYNTTPKMLEFLYVVFGGRVRGHE